MHQLNLLRFHSNEAVTLLVSPPHGFSSGSMGRLDIYREQCKHKLCDIETQKETDNVYVTLFRGLSVCQYVVVRHSECHAKHTQPCEVCAALCCVAARIL